MRSIERRHVNAHVCSSILLTVGHFAKQTNMENVSYILKGYVVRG